MTLQLHITLMRTVEMLLRETPDLYPAGFLALEQPKTQLSWLTYIGDHAGTCLPDRHLHRWWTETSADSGLVQSWPGHYRHGRRSIVWKNLSILFMWRSVVSSTPYITNSQSP